MNQHIPHEGKDKLLEPIIIPSTATKRALYKQSLKEIQMRIKDVDSLVSRMATIVSVLRSNLSYYFWCGFYFAEEKELIIGPYQGSTACAHISYDGVCGTAAKNKKTLIVPNVHDFPGHIACDERSNSEIVVPFIGEQNMVIAVLDIDSTVFSAFDEVDKECLEQLIIPVLREGS